MEHTRNDVFVSYASSNKGIADALVARLEARGIRCWYAPRDVLPGVAYPSAILEAIRESRILIVILSAASNESGHVITEVERAVNLGLHIIPVRIELVTPQGDLEYLLARRHWLDALPPPVEGHIDGLAQTVSKVLEQNPGWQRGVVTRQESRRAHSRPGARLARWAFLTAVVLVVGFGLWLRFGPDGRPVTPDRETAAIEPTDDGGEENPSELKQPVVEREPEVEVKPPPSQAPTEVVQKPEPQSNATPEPAQEAPPTEEAPTKKQVPEQIPPTTPEWTTIRDDDEVLIKRFEGVVRENGQVGGRVTYEVPVDGIVSFLVQNTMPRGSRLADIHRYRIDGRTLGGLRPGDPRPPRSQAVRGGQEVLFQFETAAGHQATFAIEAMLKRLGPLPPPLPDGRGSLDVRAESALGFDREREQHWEYQAPEHGTLQFILKNTMPDETDLAQISSVLVDRRPVGGLRPGDQKSSQYRTVREGQTVEVRVAASDGHHLTYELEASFRPLEIEAPELASGDHVLVARTGGALGFEWPRERTFQFVAPDPGRVRFTIENTMPKETQDATISRCVINDRPVAILPPGKREVTKYQTVNKGDRVKVTLIAREEDSAAFTIEPDFELDPARIVTTQGTGGIDNNTEEQPGFLPGALWEGSFQGVPGSRISLSIGCRSGSEFTGVLTAPDAQGSEITWHIAGSITPGTLSFVTIHPQSGESPFGHQRYRLFQEGDLFEGTAGSVWYGGVPLKVGLRNRRPGRHSEGEDWPSGTAKVWTGTTTWGPSDLKLTIDACTGSSFMGSLAVSSGGQVQKVTRVLGTLNGAAITFLSFTGKDQEYPWNYDGSFTTQLIKVKAKAANDSSHQEFSLRPAPSESPPGK